MTFTDLVLLVLPHHTSQRFKQWLQTYKQSKIPTKKSFYIFLYFGKWNFLALILKNSLYFLKFKETEAPQKFFIIQETKLAYISGNRTFLHPKKLNNYAFNETPSGETECLSNFYYLLAAEAFRIHCSKLLSLKCIFKNCFFKNINFISLIYSWSELSESSEELSESSVICLTTFFSIYLHSFKNTCG